MRFRPPILRCQAEFQHCQLLANTASRNLEFMSYNEICSNFSALRGKITRSAKLKKNVLLFQLCVSSPKVTKAIIEDSRKSF